MDSTVNHVTPKPRPQTQAAAPSAKTRFGLQVKHVHGFVFAAAAKLLV